MVHVPKQQSTYFSPLVELNKLDTLFLAALGTSAMLHLRIPLSHFSNSTCYLREPSEFFTDFEANAFAYGSIHTLLEPSTLGSIHTLIVQLDIWGNRNGKVNKRSCSPVRFSRSYPFSALYRVLLQKPHFLALWRIAVPPEKPLNALSRKYTERECSKCTELLQK